MGNGPRAVFQGGICDVALCVGKLYFFQSVVEDHELRLQLDRVGSIDPLLVLEQLQLQEDRDQLERDQLERLQLDRV
jgi:hypothetical protein